MKPFGHPSKVVLAFTCLCAVLRLGSSAQAETLQRLHVLSFTLTSDTARPRVDVPFHVTLTIHARERIAQPQYVYLPAFLGFENLGAQRQLTRERGGWLYRETLTLATHKAGPTAIGSAYLDAVDARDSKTKRFISNDLILHVTGGSLPSAWGAPRIALFVILQLLLLAVTAAVVVTIFRRLRPVRASDATTPEPLSNPQPAPLIGLDAALAELRIRRDRPSILRVRAALWMIAGASKGETLGDVLERAPACDNGLRRMLIAVERATFVRETGLQHAIDDALSEGEQSIAQ